MPYRKFLLSLVLGLSIFYSSCIKDEALNMEADITEVHIADSLVNAKPILNNRNIVIYIKPGSLDINSFGLTFDVTPGAKVSPESGSLQDFSVPVVYKVTSEDGKYEKEYRVTLLESSVPSSFDFEHFGQDVQRNWVYFFEEVAGMQQNLWASGNSGFAFTAGANPTLESYPTQVTEDPKYVISGKHALYLETKSTGFLGAFVKKPIAAGNLFIGSLFAKTMLDVQTRFGLPFNEMPATLSGYYKYEPGEKVIDKDSKEVQTTDECDIYAVFYDRIALMAATANDKEYPSRTWLDDQDILTSPYIVAIAKVKSGAKTDAEGMVKFEVPFEYKKEIKRVDVDAYKYNIAVVFSASKYGAEFQGAVGSKLIVDNVKINVK